MNIAQNAVNLLKAIVDKLDDDEVTHSLIYNTVQVIFKESGYSRRPYNFRFSALNRAASKDSEDWFNFSDGNPDISKFHCPPENVSPLGRCNRQGESMFYCSTENGVPVFEVRAQFKQFVVISGWENKLNEDGHREKPIAFNGIVIGVQRILEKEASGSYLKKLLLKDDIFRRTTHKVIKDIDSYLGDMFTKTTKEIPNLYKFTSAVSRIYLNNMYEKKSGTFIEGLIYPSVESRLTGQNIVLTSKFARKNLKLGGASMYQVYSHNQSQSSYSLKPLKMLSTHLLNPLIPIWRKVDSSYDDERFFLTPDTPIVPFDEKNSLPPMPW